MIVVLSGEGSSDLGACNNAQGFCHKPEFVHGPMTVLVDKEIETRLGFSMLETTPDQYIYISEKRLDVLKKERKGNKRNVALVGKKRGEETGLFTTNAWVLGVETKRLELTYKDKAIAVLFRDCDNPRSANSLLWEDKWDSMRSGFIRSEIGDCGVPMIPKPKSEAWLLCAIANGYQHCAVLESLPGNDDSPHSAKARLCTAMNGNDSSQDQLKWLEDNGFNHASVAANMPSYYAFKSAMANALAAVR